MQFPLTTSLPVTKGSIIALTVPTWAPALELGLGKDYTWKASRDKTACDDTQTQSAQSDVGDLAQYKCAYRTARLSLQRDADHHAGAARAAEEAEAEAAPTPTP